MFFDDPALVNAFDELSLWSAPFGLALLDTLRIRPGLALLDVGCGTGFPALELAGRLGPRCRVVGLDPWHGALTRARTKAMQYRLANVELIEGVAEAMPFADRSFDAIVSNNGLNNVADLGKSLAECHRVLCPGGQLVATMNLPDTMRELYGPFADILREGEGEAGLARLAQHIAARRKPVAEMRRLLEQAGFTVDRVLERSFTMRYLDGSTLFDHPFIRLAFLPPWREVPLPDHVDVVMAELRARLDAEAAKVGEIGLRVPFACYDARRGE